MSFIVAVDGPAGSGKGTITKRIKEELGLINLDTGATYRCVALAALQNGYTLQEEEKIVELVDKIDIKIKSENNENIILLNGEDVSKQIRDNSVTQIVSQISAIIPLREKMVQMQRKLALGKNVIVEGRDIGTVVFPNANLKIYLDANEEIRATRRYKENLEKGIKITYQEVLENIKLRDKIDKNKKVGALRKAEDAILVDTSGLTIDEAVDCVKKLILDKMNLIN